MGRASQVKGSGFERAVIELAQLTGWAVASFRGVRVQRKNGTVYFTTPVQADGAGWPDLVLVRGETVLFRELKAGCGKLSKDQREWQKRLALAGCDVGVWRDDDWPTIEVRLGRYH